MRCGNDAWMSAQSRGSVRRLLTLLSQPPPELILRLFPLYSLLASERVILETAGDLVKW